ncbi:MAG: GTPase [Alphaproteobacteria bacterium]|nr:GTPase [Alphaproteobacteria bacterium]
MRLKAYTAATVAEALQQIREELGEDATIVATDSEGDRVRVVAALETAEPPSAPARAAPRPVVWPAAPAKPAVPFTPAPGGPVQPARPAAATPKAPDRPRQEAKASPAAAPTAATNGVPALARALSHHRVPEALASSLLEGLRPGPSPAAVLGARLSEMLRFANLADRREQSPILLAGPPGAGKTLVIAKLAAQAALKEKPIRVITTDIDSAGAIDQLKAFTLPLQIELETADGPAALARLLARPPGTGKPQIVIDTRGVNPFDAVEMAGLSALIVASRADATLVLPAGGDAHEAAEMAEAFAHIGCSRLITTRLDIARRLGGILSAAIVGRLTLGETGASPIVAHGLQPLNPHQLARLFVADRPV